METYKTNKKCSPEPQQIVNRHIISSKENSNANLKRFYFTIS